MPCLAELPDCSLELRSQVEFLIRSLLVLTPLAPRHLAEFGGRRWQTRRKRRRFAPAKLQSCRAPAPDTARAAAIRSFAPCPPREPVRFASPRPPSRRSAI